MPEFEIKTLTTVDRAPVNRFLQTFFGATKGAWLKQHGDWWHRGAENRNAVVHIDDGAVAAYFATTPIEVTLHGQIIPTLWWIDLMVDPAFRKRGLQTMMDDNVRTRPGLKLGFPNQFHSTILEKHGWHIRRFHNHLLPLRPSGIRSVRSMSGNKGRLVRLAAAAAEPAAAAWRTWLTRFRPNDARRLHKPSAELLAQIYYDHPFTDGLTAHRSAEFIQWRYLSAPYREQLRFYVAGPKGLPTHYLISRDVDFRGLPATRILDLYGDFTDTARLREIIALATKDAALAGSNQITLMNDIAHVQPILRRAGFLVKIPVFFCSNATDSAMAYAIQTAPAYWTIADSDNDGAN